MLNSGRQRVLLREYRLDTRRFEESQTNRIDTKHNSRNGVYQTALLASLTHVTVHVYSCGCLLT